MNNGPRLANGRLAVIRFRHSAHFRGQRNSPLVRLRNIVSGSPSLKKSYHTDPAEHNSCKRFWHPASGWCTITVWVSGYDRFKYRERSNILPRGVRTCSYRTEILLSGAPTTLSNRSPFLCPEQVTGPSVTRLETVAFSCYTETITSGIPWTTSCCPSGLSSPRRTNSPTRMSGVCALNWGGTKRCPPVCSSPGDRPTSQHIQKQFVLHLHRFCGKHKLDLRASVVLGKGFSYHFAEGLKC